MQSVTFALLTLCWVKIENVFIDVIRLDYTTVLVCYVISQSSKSLSLQEKFLKSCLLFRVVENLKRFVFSDSSAHEAHRTILS